MHLGSLQLLVRCTRSDISYAVGSLATTIHSWTKASDARLIRIMGYLACTTSKALVMTVSDEMPDGKGNLVVHIFSDSDHGGCLITARSTSGWFLFLAAAGANQEVPQPGQDPTRVLLD